MNPRPIRAPRPGDPQRHGGAPVPHLSLVDDLTDLAEAARRHRVRRAPLVRLFDLVAAASLLVVLSPLFCLLAVAVKLTSRGPVFYGSPRIGQHGTVFRAWKFRSMYTDADERLQRLLAADPSARAEYARYRKLEHDPRITLLGRLLRRSSIDELPQLVNIMKGEMSVVGPRPKLLNERELYGTALPEILTVRPGLTGLWQISGRDRIPVPERATIDLDYVRNRTLPGDVMICLVTARQIWQPTKFGGM